MIPKLTMIGLALAVLEIVAVMGKITQNPENLTDIEFVSRQINDFTFDLIEELRGEKSNLAFSPISVWLVLFMTFLGTSGRTRSELLDGLHLRDHALISSFRGAKDIIQKLNSFTEVELHLANKIFVDKSLNIDRGYESRIQAIHFSGLERLNFGDSEVARTLINDWVANQTNSRIKEMIDPDTINEQTSMILVNTLYFKGEWENRFDAAYTAPRDFHLQNGTIKTVQMMSITDEFKFGEIPNKGVSFIELPYKSEGKNDTISMFVIIPENIADFENGKQDLKKIWLNDLRTGKSRKCSLTMPKFKIEMRVDLRSSLENIEIRKMFEDSLDFSHMTNSSRSVSNIIQKVFIDVNEDGTEAAAVTELSLGWRMGGQGKVVKVDKPFIIMISTDELILFSAKIFDPTQQISTMVGSQKTNDYILSGDEDQIYFPKK